MSDDRSVLGRALRILDCCLVAAKPLALCEIAARCELPKQTAWRIAEELVRRGLLAHTPDGYIGGDGLIRRADRVLTLRALRAVVVPELVDLHRALNAPVWAVNVRCADEWTLIAQIFDGTAVRDRYAAHWYPDPHRPAILATALGRMALADRPELLDALLERGVPRLTALTEVDPERLRAIVERAGRERAAIEHGQAHVGWSCIAVPVSDRVSERTIGVIGVSDRTPRFSPIRAAAAVCRTAARLESLWPPTPLSHPVRRH